MTKFYELKFPIIRVFRLNDELVLRSCCVVKFIFIRVYLCINITTTASSPIQPQMQTII